MALTLFWPLVSNKGDYRQLDGVVVVADNILVYGKGDTHAKARDQHDEALLQVLR